MATKKTKTTKTKKKSNPHEAVAPQDAGAKTKALIEPAYSGDGLGVNGVRFGGLEFVEGYEPPFAPRSLGTLPDIGELTYGTPRRIHGTDDRQQITQTNLYPWSSIVSILITGPDGSQGIGTGFFIGPKTIATCGHCVYMRPANAAGRGWARSIVVMPGRSDSVAAPGNLPFGSVTVPTSGLRTVRGWIDSGDNGFDYGAILLNTEVGRTTGWFGFGVFSDDQLKAMIGSLSGYPGDKGGGTQWYHASNITSVDERRVYYRIDMLPGHSGSPVFCMVGPQDRRAIAINAYSWDPNFGTRINRQVYDNLVSWKS
jgi:glutamyl endopeptidase